MKKFLSIYSMTAIFLIGLTAAISAAGSVLPSALPDELIARKLTKLDPSLVISVAAVRYKLKRSQPLILVDVRRQQAFERLRIPGSINIPLYAVKTKTYLKPVHVVLVNEGFQYTELQSECRRLGERGYKVSILDGGLLAWQRKGGQFAGDLFAIDEMKALSPLAFFRAKDQVDTLVLDISPQPRAVSGRLMPYAKHIPVLDRWDRSKSELRKLLKKNKPFQSIIIISEYGEQYDKAQKLMDRMGIESFYLEGGVVAYQNYLEGLIRSRKPRDSRMKTVGDCEPCGQKIEEKTFQAIKE
jgi:rhodanese-related sulfurtransferase